VIEHGEELLTGQVFEHVDQQHDVERLVPGVGEKRVDGAALGLEEAQGVRTSDLLARDVDAGHVPIAGLERKCSSKPSPQPRSDDAGVAVGRHVARR
jgi:hypothetical protein